MLEIIHDDTKAWGCLKTWGWVYLEWKIKEKNHICTIDYACVCTKVTKQNVFPLPSSSQNPHSSDQFQKNGRFCKRETPPSSKKKKQFLILKNNFFFIMWNISEIYRWIYVGKKKNNIWPNKIRYFWLFGGQSANFFLSSKFRANKNVSTYLRIRWEHKRTRWEIFKTPPCSFYPFPPYSRNRPTLFSKSSHLILLTPKSPNPKKNSNPTLFSKSSHLILEIVPPYSRNTPTLFFWPQNLQIQKRTRWDFSHLIHTNPTSFSKSSHLILEIGPPYSRNAPTLFRPCFPKKILYCEEPGFFRPLSFHNIISFFHYKKKKYSNKFIFLFMIHIIIFFF